MNIKDFIHSTKTIAGEECTLIFPKGNPEWDDNNKIYRSSIWNKEGKLVSGGFKKFCNYSEQPEFEPLNLSEPISFFKKIDGSCLIISKYKDELIVRTRNTFDARIHENGQEIDFLLKKYPGILESLEYNDEHSLIFEWFSPNRVIVEKEAQEPELWLLGIVQHKHYTYALQENVDLFAALYNLKRPERFHFNTFEEMCNCVKYWKSGEGIVVYGNNDQVLKKVKSLRYLMLHKMKYLFTPKSKVLMTHYIESGMLDTEGFEKYLKEEYDWEAFEFIKEVVPEIIESGRLLKEKYAELRTFAQSIKHLTRKEQAFEIMSRDRAMSSFVFSILDIGILGNKQLEKLWEIVQENI